MGKGWAPNREVLGVSRGVNGQELRMYCPQCGSDNFSWNPDIQLGQCWACEYHVNEFQLRRDVNEWDPSALGRGLWDPGHNAENKKKYVPEFVPDSLHNPMAQWYLLEYRKLPPQALGLFQNILWYDDTTERLHIRIQNPRRPEDHSASMSCQVKEKDSQWRFVAPHPFKENYWFNPLNLNPRDVPVVLVEGIFDVLTPQLWTNSIAILGVKVGEVVENALKSPRELYLWLDWDRAGRRASRKLKHQLPGAEVISYPKEPGDCTTEEAWTVIRSARKKRNSAGQSP